MGVTLAFHFLLLAQAAATANDAKGWYDLGRARAELARQTYQALLSRVSADSSYVSALTAEKLMYRQQYRRAFTLFHEALQKDPNLLSARSALIEIYKADGHPDWAAQEEGEIRKVSCRTHRLACDSLAGRYEAVLAATQNQQDPDALYWRAQAYTGLEYQAFAKLEQFPDSVELHRFKAGLFYEVGLLKQVVEELRKALQLAPHDTDLRIELAMAMGAAGDYAAAYRSARELLLQHPQSAELNALAGDALLNQQKALEAIPYLEKSVALDPQNVITHGSLGRAYMQTGSTKRAIQHLEVAVSTDHDGSLHYQLAKAYQKSGKVQLTAAAMKEYERLSTASKPPPETEITAP